MKNELKERVLWDDDCDADSIAQERVREMGMEVGGMNSSVGSGERANEGKGKGSGDAMISGWVMENQELGLERENLVREFLEEGGL